jgi:hypothetical protein
VLALLLSYLLRPIVRILVKARIPGGERSTSNTQIGERGHGFFFLETFNI